MSTTDERDGTMPDAGAEAGECAVTCWVYKGRARAETYLFLAEEDGTDTVPDALLAELGPLELVMSIDLHPQRRLARASAPEVMTALRDRGFYLQLPPADPDPTPGIGLTPR